MNRKTVTVLHCGAFLLAGLALAACRSTDPPEPVGDPGPVVVGESDEAPSEDHTVEAKLTKYIRGTSRVDGRRVVEFDLRNSSAEALSFAYRVEWLDRRGEPIRDQDARWIHLVLPAQASAPVEIIAPTASAESWRLRATAAEESAGRK